jgi:molybdopterin molybdotransferase
LGPNPGAAAIDLGIAPDEVEDIVAAVRKAAGADVLVVSGGASVGEHDLVQEALAAVGMELDFWRIAMRPGKPLMVGRLGATRVLGLPGNPVSAIVCSLVFLQPLIRALVGLPPQTPPETARLGAAMAGNDRRQDYVRARLVLRDGTPTVVPFDRQDSSMLATLATADALIVRPPHAPPAPEGAEVPILRLDHAG